MSLLFSDVFGDLEDLVHEVEIKEEEQKEFLKDVFKERMRTQLIARNVLLISVNQKRNLNQTRYIEELLQNSQAFDMELRELLQKKESITNISISVPHYENRILRLSKTWKEFYRYVQQIVKNPSDREALNYITSNNILLLTDIDFILRKYIEFNKAEDSFTNKLNHRNLMLFLQIGIPRVYIQKIIKEKLLIEQEIKIIENRQNLNITINSLGRLLKAFRHGDNRLGLQGVGDSKFLKKLAIVDALWVILEPLFRKELLSKEEFELMLRQSDEFTLKHTELVKFSNQTIDH